MPRALQRAMTTCALIAVAVLVPAEVASAHVTVTGPGAARGGSDQEITFRVPVEKDVDTIGLTIALPLRTPIADVLVEPVAGWTHAQKSVRLTHPIVTDDGTITDAVSQIRWSAGRGHGLKPGEFGAFTIIAGQLPDTSSLTFKAIQTYSNGSTVAWTQTEAPGSTADLANPAPVLALPSAGSHATSSSSAPSSAGPAVSAPSGAAGSGAGSSMSAGSMAGQSGTGLSDAALGLSILALLAAGAVGAVVLRSRRATAGTPRGK